MKTTVTFRHTESSDAIRKYAEEKIDKAAKLLHRPVEANLVLSVEKFRHQAELTITADGLILNSKEVTDDMYTAIDKVMEKMEKQIKKNRDRMKRRKSAEPAMPAIQGAEDEEPDTPMVIPSDRFIVKPLNIEDAILELNESNEGFVVFRNAETEQVNVLYKRNDGHYGLIEPPE